MLVEAHSNGLIFTQSLFKSLTSKHSHVFFEIRSQVTQAALNVSM